MLSVDQLDGFNLVSSELVCRNLQRLEERYREKLLGSSDGASGSSVFTSTSFGVAGSLVDPKLTKFFGDQAAQEGAIAKGLRKAREERELARKHKKKTKDKDEE